MTHENNAAPDPVRSLTRPIIGIENRSALEVFDIMSDRIRLYAARELNEAMQEAQSAHHAGGGERIPLPAVEWAVERWNAEVKNRPLVNIHRRTLDTTWRQVIRYFGGDAEALCGPDHTDLVNADPTFAAKMRSLEEAEDALPAAPPAKAEAVKGSGEVVDGWVLVPLPGAEVRSSHPRTVLNPDDTFEVHAVEVDSWGARVRGERTCWFGVKMITPARPTPEVKDAPAEAVPEPLYKRVEAILDEHSAWIARPNDEVTKRIALSAMFAAHAVLTEEAMPDIPPSAEIEVTSELDSALKVMWRSRDKQARNWVRLHFPEFATKTESALGQPATPAPAAASDELVRWLGNQIDLFSDGGIDDIYIVPLQRARARIEADAAEMGQLRAEVARLLPDGDKPSYEVLEGDFHRANRFWEETARIEREQRARATAAEAERDATNRAFNAAIDFTLEQGGLDADAFLRCWREGDWEAIAKDWPEFDLSTTGQWPRAALAKPEGRADG